MDSYLKHFNEARKKNRDTTKGDISSLLGNDFLKRFRVFHQATLFEPDWDMLKKGRCPLCFNKLKEPRTRPIVYCNGVKHKKNFVISKEKYNKIK